MTNAALLFGIALLAPPSAPAQLLIVEGSGEVVCRPAPPSWNLAAARSCPDRRTRGYKAGQRSRSCSPGRCSSSRPRYSPPVALLEGRLIPRWQRTGRWLVLVASTRQASTHLWQGSSQDAPPLNQRVGSDRKEHVVRPREGQVTGSTLRSLTVWAARSRAMGATGSVTGTLAAFAGTRLPGSVAAPHLVTALWEGLATDNWTRRGRTGRLLRPPGDRSRLSGLRGSLPAEAARREAARPEPRRQRRKRG